MKALVIIILSYLLVKEISKTAKCINDILDGRRRSTRDVGKRSHTTRSGEGQGNVLLRRNLAVYRFVNRIRVGNNAMKEVFMNTKLKQLLCGILCHDYEVVYKVVKEHNGLRVYNKQSQVMCRCRRCGKTKWMWEG